MVTIGYVLSLVVHNNWSLHQLDIDNDFLYGDLSEEIYMRLPEGYYYENETKVRKLTKSLYGLKQACRIWNAKLVSVLVGLGF